MSENKAGVIFDERGVPVSKRFDDPYFSFHDGLAESRYVFLEGNELQRRLKSGFQIAELGFGTGLNFLLTWQTWLKKKAPEEGKIEFTSFEAFPMSPRQRKEALSQFPEITSLEKAFTRSFDGENFETAEIRLKVIIGDARNELPKWTGLADAWYLDGFSPSKNPELWSEELLAQVGKHTRNNGSFATYSAAGFVRKNLQNAGFSVERIPGYGCKRHMCRGQLFRGDLIEQSTA